GRRGLDVVRVRDRDRLESLERLLVPRRADVRGQVGVVEPRAGRPAEGTARIAARAKGDSRVTVGSEAALRVVRKRSDRSRRGRAVRVAVPDRPETRATGETRVRRLRPRRSAVE